MPQYGLLTGDQVNNGKGAPVGFEEPKENGNSRTPVMPCSVRGFSSHLTSVNKHSPHTGQRNPNMETLLATVSVQGRGTVVLVSSERFLRAEDAS